MNVTEPSRADWAWMPGSPPLRATQRAGSRCSSCPRTRAPAAAAFPCAVARLAQPVALDRGLHGARPARRRVRGRRHASPPTANATACPSSCSSSTSLCPTRTAWRRWSTTSPTSPSCTTAATSTPLYHRFAHRHRVELVHAYDEAPVRGAPGRFDGKDFTRGGGLRRPRRRRRATASSPASFYGPGTRLRTTRRARGGAPTPG